MAIIKINQNVIPIVFTDDVQFQFQISDDNWDKLQELATEILGFDEVIEGKENSVEARKELKELVDKSFATLLGDEAPEQIYNLCGKFTSDYALAFIQTATAIREEFEKRNAEDNFKQYVATK